jgi:retron-type reverse transcriptase
VKKCNDNSYRHRLISILKEKINDQRFIDLIFKLFNAGIIEWKEGLGSYLSKGVAQGSVVSSILMNIYLQKLDVEIASITKEYQKRRINKEVVSSERRKMDVTITD